jgi:ketol-acid reductoisomerase
VVVGGRVTEPVRFVGEADADPAILSSATIAVVGYGNLGRSLAANLRDAGLVVIVGNRDDPFRAAATVDGFRVESIGDAVAAADVSWVLVPDEEIPSCCAADVWPAARPGAAVCFASGFPLAFGTMAVPADVDILLCAPRMPGDEVRRAFVDGSGFVTYLNAEQDASGRAWPRLLALAHGAGGLRRGAVVVTATTEALVDLYVEQTMGASLGAAIQAAFAVGVEAGIPPELLVLELYQSGELARTVAAFAREGFYRAAATHGATALFGGFVRLQEMSVDELHHQYRAVLADISGGGFAATFAAEREAGSPTLAVIHQMLDGGDQQSVAEDRVRAGLSDGAASS